MQRGLVRCLFGLNAVTLLVFFLSVPAVAQGKLKGGQNAIPCDCSNCSAEHCPAPGKGGGKSGGGKPGPWIEIDSVGMPSKSKSLKAPAKP